MAADTAFERLGLALASLILAWLCFHFIGNPLEEYRLNRDARVTTAHLVGSYETDSEDNRGKVYTYLVATYEFTVDGQPYRVSDKVPPGDPPKEVAVDYQPANPANNRIHGEAGHGTVAIVVKTAAILLFTIYGLGTIWRGKWSFEPKLSVILVLLTLTGCSPKTYEDCIFETMPKAQTDVAARNLAEACENQFPSK